MAARADAARHQFGVEGKPTVDATLVDKKRQWKHFRNIRKNAAIRSGVLHARRAVPRDREAVHAEEGRVTERRAAGRSRSASCTSRHELPPDAINRNVEGRRVAALAGGFGKMWQKTYRVALPAAEVSPQDVIRAWREHFRYFFPKKAHFYGPDEPVAPGDVVLLNLTLPGGIKMSTGVLVIYADEESFTFQTPEGHQFTGIITFSAQRNEDETVVQIQALIRASGPARRSSG